MNYKIIERIYKRLRFFFSRNIAVNGFFAYDGSQLKNNNFGDDINIPILSRLTGKGVKTLKQLDRINVKHLLCIGSVIEICNSKSIIWGTGALYGDTSHPIHEKPLRVCAVRGPLTRDYLLSQGVTCPQIYGDPALLLPLFYSPNVAKKYDIGIIPHYIDFSLPHVKKFREENDNIKFINLQNYNCWEDVIDQICSCKCILSSSLHGMIVSDAYKIPNVRVQFSDLITGGDFKFNDYCQGVGRTIYPAIDYRQEIDLDIAKAIMSEYTPICFDPKELLRSFPYKIQSK